MIDTTSPTNWFASATTLTTIRLSRHAEDFPHVTPPQETAPRGTYWRRQRAGLIGRASWRTWRERGHVGLVDVMPRPVRGQPRARVASKPRPVGLVRLRERVRWAA